MQKIYVETKNVIINLMDVLNKKKVHINDIERLFEYINNELNKQNKQTDYIIATSINCYSIYNTIDYNSDIFSLDYPDEIIMIKKKLNLNDLVSKYKVDETILELIKEFCKKNLF